MPKEWPKATDPNPDNLGRGNPDEGGKLGGSLVAEEADKTVHRPLSELQPHPNPHHPNAPAPTSPVGEVAEDDFLSDEELEAAEDPEQVLSAARGETGSTGRQEMARRAVAFGATSRARAKKPPPPPEEGGEGENR